MDFNYSKNELEALDYKAKHKNEVVKCPRCGKELIYREIGNSYEVECSTVGCIIMTVRGI